jgi:large subunit ribosomal protein L21
MSYAVIRTGGKQHRVVKGERLKVMKLEGDVGAELTISDVLAIGSEGQVKIGSPLVKGAEVKAKIVRHGRGAKVIAFKRRKRKGYRRKVGHRQDFTEVEIVNIAG